MKKYYICSVLFLLTCGVMHLRAQEADAWTMSRMRLRTHVSFLASDSLAGRLIGTEGNLIAGEYIADCFADADCPKILSHRFSPHPAISQQTALPES